MLRNFSIVFDGCPLWQYNCTMNSNELYNAIFDYPESEECTMLYSGKRWSFAASEFSAGIAMFSPGIEAECISLAKANCHWNRGSRFVIPFDDYCTAGVDFSGKTVGLVGNLKEARRRHAKDAKRMFVFDFGGGEGVLCPDEEEEYLPECDIVIVTGSSIQNGTLPHILELCRNAYVILTGPSVPQCPSLLDFGISRISGLIIRDVQGMRAHVLADAPGSPYTFGVPFMVSK